MNHIQRIGPDMLRIASQTIHRHDGSTVAAEVLARLQIGQTELSPPSFMHGRSAEEWSSLDQVVMAMVMSTPSLHAGNKPTFVNVSAGTLENDQHMHSFCRAVERHTDQRSQQLVIEIPESSPLKGKRLVARLRDIELAGAQVAIDDFGSEHAAQERLEAYAWHYCKVDLGAVQEHDNLDWLDRAIRYAEREGIQLVMEKLECLKDMEVLLPVRYRAWFQGYSFSRPKTLEIPAGAVRNARAAPQLSLVQRAAVRAG